MLVAARTALWSVGAKLPTANDYIIGSEKAFWDGIENVGLGLPNDMTSAVWKDLVGNNDMILGAYGSFDGASLVCGGGRIAASCNKSIGITGEKQSISYVLSAEKDGCAFVAGQGAEKGAVCVETKGINSFVQIANAASDNVRNVISHGVLDNPKSIVVNYENYDVISAFVNGVEAEIFYLFGGVYSNKASFGDRINDRSKPFTGRVFRMIMRSEHMTEEQAKAEYAIDKARFNLP